jgi:hypothetical protein
MTTDTTQSASTEASSLLDSSPTASTASTNSTDDSSSHLIPEQSKTPPRIVHVWPEAAPYAQLCFQQKQNRLITMMVGSASPSPTKYTPLTEETDKTTDVDVVSNDGGSSTNQDEFEVDWNLGFSDGSSSCSASSGCYHCHATAWVDMHPQDIVWMDGHWVDSDTNVDGDTWLLGGGPSASEEKSTVDTNESGCGILRSRLLRKVARKPIINMKHSRATRRNLGSKGVLGDSRKFGYTVLS